MGKKNFNKENNLEQNVPTIDSKTDSIRDFIYVDTSKIESYLSQFDIGVLKNYETSNSSSNTLTGQTEGHAGTTVIGGSKSKTHAEGIKETVTSMFDTQNTLPNTLLDILGKNTFVKENIKQCHINSIIHFHGSYRILDTSLINTAAPIAGKLLQNININTKKNALDKNLIQSITESAALIPPTIQVDIFDEFGNSYWMLLEKEFMRKKVENIILSNGKYNREIWYILGIVEQLSTKLENSHKGENPHKFQDQLTFLEEYNEQVKKLLGRPLSLIHI